MLHKMEYVAMRDGVKLFTNIWLPAESGKFPTILIRSPYDTPKNYANEPEDFGFAYVMQSCRGTAASQGDMEPYRNERRDSLDTLDWLRRQSFYNGEIIPSGGSYLSTVHLLYLDTCPPDIRGAILNVQDNDRYNIHYENGQYKAGLHLGWALSIFYRTHPEVRGPHYAAADWYNMRPMLETKERVLGGTAASSFDETFEAFVHPRADDPYWTTAPCASDGIHALERLQVPVFLSTAHYDIYIHGVPKMWEALLPETRKKSMFVISPYTHRWSARGPHPFENDRVGQLAAITKNWANYARTGVLEGMDGFELGKTNYYVLFGGRWQAEEFLSDGAEEKTLYFGDRSLDDAPTQGSASYDYDPAKPTEFAGNCGNVFGEMKVQTEPEGALIFRSAPMKETVTVKGVQKIRLKVRSDCEDTAFYVRLSLVQADGTAYGIRDRITSLSYELGSYTPGEEAEITLALDPVAFEVKAGESLRVDVASSYAEAYIPHPNVAGLWCAVRETKVAHNTVIFGDSALMMKYDRN